MDTPTPHTHFDFAKLTERERYKLLIGTVIPRPIVLVTAMSREGRANARPFSFFNVLTHDPAIVAIGVENQADRSFKDTARNIDETKEFTVHIVDNALVAQMQICAIKFGPEVVELAEADLETAPGAMVRSRAYWRPPPPSNAASTRFGASAPPARSSSAKSSGCSSGATPSIRRTSTSTSR